MVCRSKMSKKKSENQRDVTNEILDGEMPQGQSANEEVALGSNFKVLVSLWFTRLKIIFFIIFHLLSWSIFGDLYYKILLGYAAENFVCLQQRLSKPQLRLKYLKKLLLEDCSLNILYSLIFYFYHPLPWVWLPILLFAILHAANHPWFDEMNKHGLIARSLTFLESQSTSFLKIIAVTEIFIIFLIPFHLQDWSFRQIVFTYGTTCFYMEFLVMRFHSRQNPFTRIVMDELQDEIEILSLDPCCPAIVRHLLSKVAALITSRFGRSNKELQRFNNMKKPLFGKNGFLSGLA